MWASKLCNCHVVHECSRMWYGADAGGDRAQVARSDLSSPPYWAMASLRGLLMVRLARLACWWVSKATWMKKGTAPLVHLGLDDALELGQIVEECHVPIHGHVGEYVAYGNVGPVWPVDGDDSPVFRPCPSGGLVCAVTYVDRALFRVGDHGMVLGPAFVSLYALPPLWDCAHVWLSGGRLFPNGSHSPLSGACAASGSLVGRWKWWQWRWNWCCV